MDMKLVISLALLSSSVSGQPSLDLTEGLQKAISNLQVLIPLIYEDTLGADAAVTGQPAPEARDSDRAQTPHSYLSPRSVGSPLVPKSQASLLSSGAHHYEDGAFSNIPDAAFTLDAQEPRWNHRLIKKHMNHPRRPRTHALTDKLPEHLVRSCLDLVQGKSQPRVDTLELLLNMCVELLDVEGVEGFEARDDENGKKAESPASMECECHPRGLHEDRGMSGHHHLNNYATYTHMVGHLEPTGHGADDNGLRDVSAEDVFRWFRPLGGRREWMLLNSENPDNKLKQYIDVEK